MIDEKQLIRSFQPTVSKVAAAVAMSFFGRIFSVFFAIGLGNLGSNALGYKAAVFAASALVYTTSLGVIAGEAMRNRALGEILNVLWCYLVICIALTFARGSSGTSNRVLGISKRQARERVL